MRLLLVTDAWSPQVNGVVTTLLALVEHLHGLGHEVQVVHPGLLRTVPCPGYPDIQLALRPSRLLGQLMDQHPPDAVHIVTEGPLGWAARRHCLRRGWAFTTAFHTKFPDILHAAVRLPLDWGYAVLRRFHRPSAGVMVPTLGVLGHLEKRGFARLLPWTHGVDPLAFAYQADVQVGGPLGHLPRPLYLFVGRISYEKNIAAFLSLDLPGTKVVCGTGPLAAQLRARYPQVHWLGLLPHHALAPIYASADVLVFPSRTDTFGLVILEALACGTPVAAFPVDGPLQVLTDAQGQVQGGALHTDLGRACALALQVPRAAARQRALSFGWAQAAAQFVEHLVPVRSPRITADAAHASTGLHPVVKPAGLVDT